jgi:signal transduction histidine kinase
MTDVNFQVPANEEGWQSDDIIDAALQSFSNQRCRHAIVHDVRGGLQAVSSSLELLSRSAKTGWSDPDKLEKVASLAKRALLNHERGLTEMLDQLLTLADTAARVNVANLVEELRRFLRSDCESRDIRLSIDGDPGLYIHMPPITLRRVLSNLLTLHLDAAPSGTELKLAFKRTAEHGCLELSGPRAFGSSDSADPIVSFDGSTIPRAQLVLAGARHWLPKAGARLELVTGTPGVLRIYCPLSDA